MACGVLSYVLFEVYYGDYSLLSKHTIRAKLEEETALFYRDGKTRIGSIFESRHRRYVTIDEIPAVMLNAIVAAEDKNFYRHIGIDPAAISKAFAEGVLAGGRFRRGGSTITQQTVKNIVNDWETSFTRKFREMIRALQIERLYSKEQILEFYLNQFHVVGNGNGVEIAARYYFDKDVRDLDLVEAAFIAGSVKGPSKYNPFIKYSEAARERARFYAKERKDYVIEKMYEQGWISRDDLQQAIQADVPFKKGEFRTAEVALVNLVQRQLQKQQVLSSLGLRKVEDLSTAGLKVFTTIDHRMQKAAQLAMRRNLSRVATLMNGFSLEGANKFKNLRELESDSFVYGRAVKLTGNSWKDFAIEVDFGIPKGTIPNASLVRYAKLLALIDGRKYSKHLEEIVQKIEPGSVLFVQVLKLANNNKQATLELHRHPQVSGGLIALDKGNVRAVVSGFDTLGYNRAIHARRQPGSVFKTLVYNGAIGLGWSIIDTLDNTRQVFPYQGELYFPRPDHISRHNSVSLLWSGVLSENIAAVNLTYRLLEKLEFPQFKKLLSHLNLAPLPNENPSDYHYRVSKRTGISLDNAGIREYQLRNYVQQRAPDLVFSGNQKLLNTISHTWWGTSYINYIQELAQPDVELSAKEKALRLDLVLNNYQRLSYLNDRLPGDWEQLKLHITDGIFSTVDGENSESLTTLLAKFRVVADTPFLRLAYYDKLPEEEPLYELAIIQGRKLPGRPLSLEDLATLNESLSGFADHEISQKLADSILIDGILPSAQITDMQQFVNSQFEEIRDIKDPYRLYSYFQHHDFRVGLGLYYLSELTKACGVSGPVEPILSVPLGSHDLTTAEVAKIYQTFIEGRTYRFYDSGPANQINFIDRIEDRFGNVLFKVDTRVHQLVPLAVAQQTREVLRKTVTHGTGRRARGELYVKKQLSEDSINGKAKIRVPSFGKTGTTNKFITSYFAGFLPYPVAARQKLDPHNSLVVATYVGYDLNREMRNGRQRIYGGKGALPIWTDFLKSVIDVDDFATQLDSVDLEILARKEWPLKVAKDTQQYLVDLPGGAILRTADSQDIEVWKMTNYAVTGEEYQNLFSIDQKTSSILNLYPDASSSDLQPLRIFALFDRHSSSTNKGSWDQSLSPSSKRRSFFNLW